MPFPPDFISFAAARSRAWDLWKDDQDARLHWFLLQGELQAYAFEETGHIVEIENTFWSSENYRSTRFDGVVTTSTHREGSIVYSQTGTVAFQDQHFAGLLARYGGSAAPVQSPALAKNKGGKPPKTGIDDFWVEVCRLVYCGEQGGAGHTQAAFVEAMLKWSEQHQASDAYGSDAIHKKIKKLWKGLALGNNR